MAKKVPQKLPIAHQLGQMIAGNWLTQMIYVAAKLDIATRLAKGPRSAAELAKATKMHERSLYRLLRALASVGIFAETPAGKFKLTPMAACLRDDVPGSQRAMAILTGEEMYGVFGQMFEGVRTGKIQFDRVHGQPFFNWLSRHPEKSKNFDRAMVSAHGREASALVDAYNFKGVKNLTDVGGGNGSLITTVLKANKHINGSIYDLPDVAQRAKANLKAAGVAGRCKTIGGSFFESIPAGSDTYMMRHIIHDWDDKKCIKILRNIAKVIPANGRLLVIESVIEKGNAPSFGKLLDITMLLIPGGMERTREEFGALLKAGGFKITRIIPTQAEVSVIEAKKI
jgi:hypothetical protein